MFKHLHQSLFASCILAVLSGLRQSLAIESPLKVMENAFYFILKTLFVIKIFKFLSWLFCHNFIRNIRLISSFMTSQPEKQAIAIHILPHRNRRLISTFMTSQPEKQAIAVHISPHVLRSNDNGAI